MNQKSTFGIRAEYWVLLKICSLVLLFAGSSFAFLKDQINLAFGSIPFVIWLSFSLFNSMKKAQKELEEFVEAVKYRDFSMRFNIQQASSEVKNLRIGFNEISSTFRTISREKETQFQYLQQILELVDIGILSYEAENGDVQWMNQACKALLGIPYLRNIALLQHRNESLLEAVKELRPGQTVVHTLRKDHKDVKVQLAASVFMTEGKMNKIVAFQNINLALDENEALAWQKLLSVMTHEIMNSIAPISSLAGTLKKRIEQLYELQSLSPENLEDLSLGLETIERRGAGLLSFAQSYRQLNKAFNPKLKTIFIRDLFENILTLMQPTLAQKQIEVEVILKDSKLTAQIDESLIEQVLINLLLNAFDAVKDKDQPRIMLSAYHENEKLYIRVSDNGNGIPPEMLDKIFIPFFSTKKTGSGIGLSFCKQIMLLHKGNIQVYSKVGEGSVFELGL